MFFGVLLFVLKSILFYYLDLQKQRQSNNHIEKQTIELEINNLFFENNITKQNKQKTKQFSIYKLEHELVENNNQTIIMKRNMNKYL